MLLSRTTPMRLHGVGTVASSLGGSACAWGGGATGAVAGDGEAAGWPCRQPVASTRTAMMRAFLTLVSDFANHPPGSFEFKT